MYPGRQLGPKCPAASELAWAPANVWVQLDFSPHIVLFNAYPYILTADACLP
jgi:hypothetical protein